MQRANEVRFDSWTLRVDSGELMRGGATVRLQAQPLQVLQALLEHPGEVVPREALVARLWPSGIVDFDTALNSAVRRLRHALDDVADAPRYVETIPRRGYRFIGEIDAQRRIGVGAAVTRIAASREPVFHSAVLGVAVIFALASLGFGADSRADRNGPRDTPEALHAGDEAGSTVSRDNAEAATRYREARYFYQRRAPGDLQRARTRFEQAIALNPYFASAHAGLSSTDFMLTMEGGIDRDAGFDRVRAAAERAIAIDPSIAEAHYRLGAYARFANDPRKADEEARIAMSLEPSGAIAFGTLSSTALAEGRVEEGVEFARKAVAAEPLALNYRYNLAAALFLANRIDEAKRVNLEALELSPTFNSDIAAMAMIVEHDFEPALALIEQWPDGPARQECLALAYFGLHRSAEADAALALLIRTVADTDPLRIVEVYAYRGDQEAAFRWLDVGMAFFQQAHAKDRAGVWPWMLRLSPFAASLRGTQQWKAWVKTSPASVSASG